MDKIIKEMMIKPKVFAVIAEPNQGKSNLLYSLIIELSKGGYEHNLYSYGLRCDLGEKKIHSLSELESIIDSIIIVDEFNSLFDLDNSRERRAIENSLRLIYHNNNIIILAGLPDNYKKFISAKVDIFIYKTCTIGGFINGSRAKAVCLQYKGDELGSTRLQLPIDECLMFNGEYTRIKIPYVEKYDTKLKNKPIIKKRK